MNLVTIIVLLITVPALFWAGHNLPWTPLHVVGLLLMATGFIFLFVARIQLGNAFSLRPRATQLVTTGLYARIRNPIYIFSAVAMAGVILWLNRPRYLLLLIVLIPMQAWRARKEAAVLREHFGNSYDDYSRNTWF